MSAQRIIRRITRIGLYLITLLFLVNFIGLVGCGDGVPQSCKIDTDCEDLGERFKCESDSSGAKSCVEIYCNCKVWEVCAEGECHEHCSKTDRWCLHGDCFGVGTLSQPYCKDVCLSAEGSVKDCFPWCHHPKDNSGSCVNTCLIREGVFFNPMCGKGMFCIHLQNGKGYCSLVSNSGTKESGASCLDEKSKDCDRSKGLFCDGKHCRKSCYLHGNSKLGFLCEAGSGCVKRAGSTFGGECKECTSKEICPSLGLSCKQDKECKQGLNCLGGKCRLIQKRRCSVGKGDCDLQKGIFNNKSCSVGMYCGISQSRETCLSTYYLRKGKVELDQPCTFFHSEGYCDEKKMLFCDDDTKLCVQGCDIRKGVSSNPSCKKDQECVGAEEFFYGGRCVDKRSRKLGQSCDNKNKGCLSEFFCERGKCRRKILKLGESCLYMRFSHCDWKGGFICGKYGKCVHGCNVGQDSSRCKSNEECLGVEYCVNFEGGCVPKAAQKLEQKCNDHDKQCILGLHCVNDFCRKKCSSEKPDCGQGKYCYDDACVNVCDAKKGTSSNKLCHVGEYCNAKGYCISLPRNYWGGRIKGQYCDREEEKNGCNESGTLVCYKDYCVEGCDPKKGLFPNPSCKPNEGCFEETGNHMGGICKVQPIQKKLQACNSVDLVCISGLMCYKKSICVKKCSKSEDCGKEEQCSVGSCLKKCDPKKGRLNHPACEKKMYCDLLCRPFPGLKAKKVLLFGAKCYLPNDAYCDVSQGLFCYGQKCAQGCDLKKGRLSNPNCRGSDVCISNTDSFLGGMCEFRSPRKLGEFCNAKYKCSSGLACFETYCYKSCRPTKDNKNGCLESEECHSSVCLKKCSRTDGVIPNSACHSGYYCSSRDYCERLWTARSFQPAKFKKQLNEKCEELEANKKCDGTKGLFCNERCKKACDPYQGQLNNPKCSHGFECIINISKSHLGGECKVIPTQEEGQKCTTYKVECLARLLCVDGACHKKCRKGEIRDCKAPEVCVVDVCLRRWKPKKIRRKGEECQGSLKNSDCVPWLKCEYNRYFEKGFCVYK